MTQTARAELAAALERIPRVALAALPTPLDAAPRLAAALDGPEIWIKRDDLTGLCFGGNKTRQLEFVFADMLAKGCDTVVAGAYTQSNWCRQMTAAASKLGLDISLVLLHGEKGPVLQGNYLLYRLMGASIDSGRPALARAAPAISRRQGRDTARGRSAPLRRRADGSQQPVAGCDRLRQGGARARSSNGRRPGSTRIGSCSPGPT